MLTRLQSGFPSASAARAVTSREGQPNLSSLGVPWLDLEEIYRATVRAGIQLLVVCTGSDYAPRQTYREQFTNAFSAVSFSDLLRLEYFEEADHTFRSPSCRNELTNVVEDWCKATNFARIASSGSAYADQGSEPHLTATKALS